MSFYGPTFIFNSTNSSPDSATLVYCVELFKGNVVYISGISYDSLENGIGSTDFYGKIEVVRMSSVTNNLKPFVPPTIDNVGKEGLVPQPQATAPSLQLNNILTMQGWSSISAAFLYFDKTNTVTNQLVPTALQLSEELSDANTLVSGVFHSSSWKNTPGFSGILISYQVLFGENYGCLQLFFSYAGHSSYRTTGNEISLTPGGKPQSDDWAEWIPIGAPKPQVKEGICQWTAINNSGGGNTVTLPPEGVWAYHLSGYNLTADELHTGDTAGITAGGTNLTIGNSSTEIRGFAWQISA